VRIDLLTLFPAICEGPLGESMLKRAREKGLLDIRIHNLRDWATGKHLITDDTPYGGGQGMVMKCEPIFAAVEAIKAEAGSEGDAPPRVVYLSPSGRQLNHGVAAGYAAASGHLILLCGHYEGVDQRVIDHLVDDEISIGDYVLTNGAIAAAVFVDAVARLIPGVLGHEDSAAQDSFAQGILEGPQYTRPVEFRGWRVPDILLSGNHAQIAQWRAAQALEKTRKVRPDLLDKPPNPD
jgi:tRNA (guanine37-N1)-methyltransferase